MTASTLTFLASFMTSSAEGADGLASPAAATPRATSPDGITYTAPEAINSVLNTSRTRSPANWSLDRLANGRTATVLIEPKSMVVSRNTSLPGVAQPPSTPQHRITMAAHANLYLLHWCNPRMVIVT